MAGLPGIQMGAGPGFVDKAKGLLAQSGQTFAQQDRIIKAGEPKKDAIGGLGAAASGASMGLMVGGPWGAAAGAVVGLGAYMLM
jgi:hypothetical protein